MRKTQLTHIAVNRLVLGLTLVLASCSPHVVSAADAVSTWDGSTGDWSNVSRWDTSAFPNNGNGGQTFDVIVGSGNITLDQNITIDGLSMSSGTVDGMSDLALLTGLNWTGGSIAGTGTLTANGGMLAGNTKLLNRTLRLTDNADWSIGTITFSSSAGQIELRNNATFTDSGSVSKALAAHLDIGTGTTFQKNNTGTTTHGQFSTSLTNDGTVNVSAGALDLMGNGSGGGSFVVDAELRLRGGIQTYSGPFSGPGTVLMNGGEVDLSGSYAVANTAVTSGMLRFSSGAVTNMSVTQLSGGRLESNSGLTISNLAWSGGTLAGPGTTVVSAATLNGSSKILEAELEVTGPVDWTHGTITFASNAGQVDLLSGSTLTDSGTSNRALAADLVVRNGATYVHTNTGLTNQGQFGTTLTNDGTIDITAGVVDLLGDGTGSGNFDVAGELEFSLGTHMYSGTIAGPGNVRFSGANVQVSGSYQMATTTIAAGEANFATGGTVNLGDLTLSGGALIGNNDVTIPQLNWTGGNMRGLGTATAVAGTLSGSTKLLEQTLQIAGDIDWSAGTTTFSNAAGTIVVLPGATFTDSGTSSRALAANLEVAPGAIFRHTNTGNTTQGQFGTTLDNDGLVEVAAGVLDLFGDVSGAGSFDVAGELDLSGGSPIIDGMIMGNGLVRFSGAAAEINGGYAPGNTVVLSGTASFNAVSANLGNTTVSSGFVRGSADLQIPHLTWNGGTFSGTGVATVQAGTLGSSTKFLEQTMHVDGDVEWTQGTITFGTSAGAMRLLTGATLTGSGSASRSMAADLLIDSGAIYIHDSTGTTTQGQFGTSFTNDGTLRVAAGTFHADGGFANFDVSTSTLTGGTYDISSVFRFRDADVDTNQANIMLDGPGSMIVNTLGADALNDLSLNDSGATLAIRGGRDFASAAGVTNRGTIALSDGGMFASASIINESSGTLAGVGTFAPTSGIVTNAGIVTPGASAGTLNMTADYSQTSTGRLMAELGGLANSDLLSVTGTATLDGVIELTLIDGYSPLAGDSIELLNANGGVSGSFAVEVLPMVPDIALEVRYEPTSVFVDAFHSVDFDRDGDVDGVDVDALVVEIVAQTNGAVFDLSGDGVVDDQDLSLWLAGAGAVNLPSQAPYLPGDANLDGNVDGQDFVIWNANKFTSIAGWTMGDFTANGVIDGADFVAWNANKFMSADQVSTVPEPSRATWLLVGVFVLCGGSGKRRSGPSREMV